MKTDFEERLNLLEYSARFWRVKSKIIVAVAIILSITNLASINIWSSNHRYDIVAGGDIGYQLDRKTGETWILRGIKKISHQ